MNMTYENALNVIKTVRDNLKRCGGCYVKGDITALNLAIDLIQEKLDELHRTDSVSDNKPNGLDKQ